MSCWPGTQDDSFLCHVADMLANMSVTRLPDRHMSVVLTLVSTRQHPILPAKAGSNDNNGSGVRMQWSIQKGNSHNSVDGRVVRGLRSMATGAVIF